MGDELRALPTSPSPRFLLPRFPFRGSGDRGLSLSASQMSRSSGDIAFIGRLKSAFWVGSNDGVEGVSRGACAVKKGSSITSCASFLGLRRIFFTGGGEFSFSSVPDDDIKSITVVFLPSSPTSCSRYWKLLRIFFVAADTGMGGFSAKGFAETLDRWLGFGKLLFLCHGIRACQMVSVLPVLYSA
jgi:hypothetical protein